MNWEDGFPPHLKSRKASDCHVWSNFQSKTRSPSLCSCIYVHVEPIDSYKTPLLLELSPYFCPSLHPILTLMCKMVCEWVLNNATELGDTEWNTLLVFIRYLHTGQACIYLWGKMFGKESSDLFSVSECLSLQRRKTLHHANYWLG